MKKAVRTLVSFLETNRGENDGRSEKEKKLLSEKAPKALLLTCPGSLPFLSADRAALYTVESLGAAVRGCEATLDHGVRRLELPLLIIVGHDGCGALDRAVKLSEGTDAEKAVYEAIAAGLDGHTRAGRKRVLSHIDGQVACALERYGDRVKAGKLVVVGLYLDEAGTLLLTNYNGLKGREALAYGLPEVNESFFLPS